MNESNVDHTTWLGFELAGQDFAVPLLNVREVIRPEPPTPVPGAPTDVLGIINLRGNIITVLDGCRRLGLDGPSAGPNQRLMIFHAEDDHVGMPIDALQDILELDTQYLESPPVADSPVLGVLKRDGGSLMLLDAGTLCRPRRFDGETPA